MLPFALKIAKTGTRLLSASWPDYSRLILVGDRAGWSLDWDVQELNRIAKRLGISTRPWFWQYTDTHQAVFFASHYAISESTKWLNSPHRIGISFPEGVPDDDKKQAHPVFQAICQHHKRIQRIQVSHQAMRNYLLESGIDSGKVFVIPLGINTSFFHYQDTELKQHKRAQLNIPKNAFVVGSFQKDGVGWEEGLEPKLVKGPDIFVQTIEQLMKTIPELFVLLVGPARGYTKTKLDRLGVRYLHIPRQPYPEIGQLFSTLDLYLVTSRQEGGPKAVLESMAAGVPLVTTRVGQAMDLVRHGENGWMVAVEDVEGLAHWANHVYQNQGPELASVLENGRLTAEANAYEKQLPLWKNFMQGFVTWEN
jgi:glycosyltransferase involved in cell wall biosynthesis